MTTSQNFTRARIAERVEMSSRLRAWSAAACLLATGCASDDATAKTSSETNDGKKPDMSGRDASDDDEQEDDDVSPAERGDARVPMVGNSGDDGSVDAGRTRPGDMSMRDAGTSHVKPPPSEADASSGAVMNGDAEAGRPVTCEKGKVKASEVVFIGESFIAQTNAIPRLMSDLARQAGTIGASENYRSFAVSGTQLTTGAIPGQYTKAARESPVKVVLMDGGGNDLLLGNRCKGSFDTGCKDIIATVERLFAEMKTGGVQDVVYFFYPDPMGIGDRIKDAMDLLRPEMKKTCDGATDVRCIWVDQRESWEGNYSTFTSDGIHPTNAGSMASAKQIWDAMVEHCVAQ